MRVSAPSWAQRHKIAQRRFIGGKVDDARYHHAGICLKACQGGAHLWVVGAQITLAAAQVAPADERGAHQTQLARGATFR